ncbi:hypothetical protein FVE85_7702 [Porphyridium purpureum]|uniref:Uncharacterized protein n=1 Tax=Porphyridium purpureum TaxID=35688 RepID=A0A5J4YIK7_PORPP|nr:hypothetical protein FVE85_7702 [Porphyridium purpureum]|eukprot:POR5818..scf210_14
MHRQMAACTVAHFSEFTSTANACLCSGTRPHDGRVALQQRPILWSTQFAQAQPCASRKFAHAGLSVCRSIGLSVYRPNGLSVYRTLFAARGHCPRACRPLCSCARRASPVHAGVWLREIPSSSDEDVNEPSGLVVVDRAGYSIAVGTTSGDLGQEGFPVTNNGGLDVFLWYLNATSGETLRVLLIGTDGDEVAQDIAYDRAGGRIAILGSTTGQFPGAPDLQGSSDMFVAVLNDTIESTPTVFVAGTPGRDDPVKVIFVANQYFIAVGNGRNTTPQPTTALFLRIDADLLQLLTSVQLITPEPDGYFSFQTITPKGTLSGFGATYELWNVSEESDAVQTYNLTDYSVTFEPIESRAMEAVLASPSGRIVRPIDGSNLEYAQNRYYYFGSYPGWSNPLIEPNSSLVNVTRNYIGFEDGRSSNDNLVVGNGENAVIELYWPPTALSIDHTAAGTSNTYYAFRSFLDRDVLNGGIEVWVTGWEQGPLSLLGPTQQEVIDSFVPGDNWFLTSATQIDAVDKTFLMYGQRWNLTESPFDCMGSEMRRNMSWAVGVSDSVLGYADLGTQCPEANVDTKRGEDADGDGQAWYYYTIGATTGSMTGQVRNNAGQTNTTVVVGVLFNRTLSLDSPGETFTVPSIDVTCELPCMSIPPSIPPSPSPSPSPSPTPFIPTPSPSPSPSPSPTPSPTPTPTPTIGPLPVEGNTDWGVIVGSVIGAVAASVLVVGLGVALFTFCVAGTASAAGAAAAASTDYYG